MNTTVQKKRPYSIIGTDRFEHEDEARAYIDEMLDLGYICSMRFRSNADFIVSVIEMTND